MATSHQHQVNDPEYHNWVRCVLGLKYTQEGVYPFLDNEAREFHKNLTANVSAQLGIQSLNCNQCTIKTLLPNHVPGTCPARKINITSHRKCICTSSPATRRPCPADVCGRLYDEIVSAHRYGDPAWLNSDMTLWTGNHWEVIKNFLPSTGGYKHISSAVDTDCSGLLNIAINVKDITTRHGIASAPDVFVKCRTARNNILHSSNQKLSDADRDNFIQIMVDVLECTPALKSDQAAQQAVAKLQQVKSDLYIVTAADIVAAKQEVQHMVAEGLERIGDETAEGLVQVDKKTAESLVQVGDETTKSLARLDDKTNENLSMVFDKTKNFAQIVDKTTEKLEQLLEKTEGFTEVVDKKLKSLGVSAQNAEGILQQMQEDGNKFRAVVYQRDGEWNKQGEEDGSCFKSDDDNIDVNQRDGERNEQDEEDGSGLESDDDDIEAAGVKRWSALALRSYQLELAENALQGRNTIICAETGSGKTWVALYIVEQHFKQAANAPKKAVFVARTGSLAKQQADRFKKYLQDLKSKLVTGEDDDSKKVGLFLPDNDVIFLTPQILINNLDNGSVASLRDFSLLILDECHHTKKDEAYNNLMRKYLSEKGEKNELDLPQVVGLTASIGVGKSASDVEACEYIMKMCARLDVRVISTVEKNKEELKKHTANTSEEIVTMAVRKQDPCKEILMEAIEEAEKELKELSILQRSMTRLWCKPINDKESQEYQKWTLDVMEAAISDVNDEELARNIRSCAMYLNVYNAALEVNSLLQKEDVAAYLADRLENETKRKMSDLEKDIYSSVFDVQCKIIGLDYTNPNLNFIRETLYKMLQEKGEDSRAMVFVKTRATCMSLARFLDDSFQDYGIKVQPFYGKGTKGSDEGMTEAQQNEAIEMFRKGNVKVLVATSVGSEGLDIPDCNIVLSYNYSGNEVTKIQMKGRSRKKGGVHFTFGSEKTINQEKMNVYKAAMMQRALNLFINKQRQSPDVIERKITSFQEEERRTYRLKQEAEKIRLARKKSKDDQEILCIRCAVFLCQLSDVRVYNKSQYVIIDKEFEKRIEVTPHKSPKKYEGLHKKFKMRCKKCPNDLGIVAEYRSLPCRIFKLQSLKFKDCANGQIQTYKDWKTVPYEISEVGEEDLQVLLG